MVDVTRVVALLDQAQAELGVLADAPLGPAADLFQRAPTHHGHGAVLDQRVALVAVVHADAEEAVELPVAHALEGLALPVAVGLRRLHDGDLGLVEVRHQAGQPVGIDHVVGVDDAHHLGARIGDLEAVVERAGLEAGPVGEVEEAEARTELGAAALERLPQGLVAGVVVEDQDLEVLVIHLRQAVDGGDHHLGRLVVAGQVDGHEGLLLGRVRRQRGEAARPFLLEEHLAELEAVRQQHRRGHAGGTDQQHQTDEVALGEVVLDRHVDADDQRRDAGLDQRGEEEAAADAPAGQEEGGEHHRDEGERGGVAGLVRPVRVALDHALELVLGLAVGVEHAPVGPGPAFDVHLPRLVDRFHQEVVDACGARMGEELAHEARLVVERGDGGVDGRAAARPAHFADHDLLARVCARDLVVALEGVLHRLVHRQALVVRQEVHGDVVDVLGEFRIAQPDVPGLGGRDRLADRLAHLVEIDDELVDRDVAAQDGLVADHDALDVAHLACRLDQGCDFARVGLGAGVDPGAGRDQHVALAGEIEQLGHVVDAVGAQAVGVASEQVEVGGELGARGVGPLERALVALEAVVGEALDALVGADELGAAVELLPDPVLREGDHRGDGDCGEDADCEGGGVLHRGSWAPSCRYGADVLRGPRGPRVGVTPGGCGGQAMKALRRHDRRPGRTVTKCARPAGRPPFTPTARILFAISAPYEPLGVAICNTLHVLSACADFEGKAYPNAN